MSLFDHFLACEACQWASMQGPLSRCALAVGFGSGMLLVDTVFDIQGSTTQAAYYERILTSIYLPIITVSVNAVILTSSWTLRQAGVDSALFAISVAGNVVYFTCIFPAYIAMVRGVPLSGARRRAFLLARMWLILAMVEAARVIARLSADVKPRNGVDVAF